MEKKKKRFQRDKGSILSRMTCSILTDRKVGVSLKSIKHSCIKKYLPNVIGKQNHNLTIKSVFGRDIFLLYGLTCG